MLKKTLFHILVIAGLGLAMGCSVLPSSDKSVHSPWKTFKEAQDSFKKVKPGKTTVAELKSLGYDPEKTPNINIENFLQIRSRFDPYQRGTHIPKPVADCLAHLDLCHAYVANTGYSRDKRTGNVILDITNIHRKTETTGWQFEALFVVYKDLVVYKLWSGAPLKTVYQDETNPLGPIQGFTNKLY